MTSKRSKRLIHGILGIYLHEILRHRLRKPSASSLTISQDIESLLACVLGDSGHKDTSEAYTHDLLAYLCGPLKDRTIDSLPDNLLVVTSQIGNTNTAMIVAAALGDQAPLDRSLNTDYLRS
jgi:hypothetical protein